VKTLEALDKDISLQVEFLKKFNSQSCILPSKQKNIIFCGTGDSYVAALLAEVFSNLRSRALDPLDLETNPLLGENKTIYLISISGNTISNIRVAKKSKAIAITRNTKSKLAKNCSNAIPLDYPDSGVFTAGSIGFLSSMLTCVSLVSDFSIPDTTQLFKKASSLSKSVKLTGKIFILGNHYTYPLAMYAAAKIYEILGLDAQYEKIEQFSHMGLFSTKKGDTVILFDEKSSYTKNLTKHLEKLGINVIHPNFTTKTKITSILFFVFFSQLVPLFAAKKKHQKECYFVTAKNIRNASSDMIY